MSNIPVAVGNSLTPLRFLLHKMSFPGILGSSFGGRVVKVGKDAGEFTPGDRVACCRPSSKYGDHRYGAFQKYALASIDESSILEPRTEVPDGVATLFNLSVSVAALSLELGIERPPAYGKGAPKNQRILVYGGSSSTGGFAVSYASFSGYTVVTTSSQEHSDYVSTLGARTVIDHTQSEAKIVAKLKANGPYDYIFDAIGLPQVTDILSTYLGEKGGKYATLLPLTGGEKPIPENVKRVFGGWSSKMVDPANLDFGKWFYQEYVPSGLGSGGIIPTRQIEVVGGLEKVQKVLDEMGPIGVSGHKFMLNPQA